MANFVPIHIEKLRVRYSKAIYDEFFILELSKIFVCICIWKFGNKVALLYTDTEFKKKYKEISYF